MRWAPTLAVISLVSCAPAQPGLEALPTRSLDGCGPRGLEEPQGLDVVMDRCMKVEHARYLGRMHWFGFNTGRITALRGS